MINALTITKVNTIQYSELDNVGDGLYLCFADNTDTTVMTTVAEMFAGRLQLHINSPNRSKLAGHKSIFRKVKYKGLTFEQVEECCKRNVIPVRSSPQTGELYLWGLNVRTPLPSVHTIDDLLVLGNAWSVLKSTKPDAIWKVDKIIRIVERRISSVVSAPLYASQMVQNDAHTGTPVLLDFSKELAKFSATDHWGTLPALDLGNYL